MARFIALIYNWWSLLCVCRSPANIWRPYEPGPLLLMAVAESTRHARQTMLKVASSHAKARSVANVLRDIARFLNEPIQSAEQLTADQRWRRILAHAVRSWLGGRSLRAPPRLMAPA